MPPVDTISEKMKEKLQETVCNDKSNIKILKVKVTAVRSKVKSRSFHDTIHLHPLASAPTKCQHPTPHSL